MCHTSVAPAAGPQGFLTLRAPRHACIPADLQTSAVLRCPLCTSPLTRHPRVLCRCLATPPYCWPHAASRCGPARTAHLGRGSAAAALPDRRPRPRGRQLVREGAQPNDRPPRTQAEAPRFPAKDPIVRVGVVWWGETNGTLGVCARPTRLGQRQWIRTHQHLST